MFPSKLCYRNSALTKCHFFPNVRKELKEVTPLAEPQFIGVDNPKMSVASDGTKCCFLFRERESASEFANALSSLLNGVQVDIDSWLGYSTLYVPAKCYYEAIEKGLNVLLNCKNGYWIDFDNERSYYDFEQLLTLVPHKRFFDQNGNWKVGTEVLIKVWTKKLEMVLGMKVVLNITNPHHVKIGINRDFDAHLHHTELLNKIRNSNLLRNCPFEGYAYVDYYGRYIK